MFYYLGPWELSDDAEGKRWHPPEGTLGLVDLRPLAPTECFGFFATEKELGSDYLFLGSQLDEPVKEDLAGKWASALGISRLEGATVLDCLWEILTVRADPEGGVRAKPILPTHLGMLELHLGGDSLVRSRRFQGVSDPAWPNIQAVLQADYRVIYAQALKAESTDRTVHQRLLGAWQAKYGLADARLFIPSDLPVEVPIRPQTTISDNFNRATLGANWTAVDGTWDIYNSVQLRNTAEVVIPATLRYDASSLSSDDHYAQITYLSASMTSKWMGPMVRFASDGETGYCARIHALGTERNIYKDVAGTLTSLWTDANGGGPPQTIKLSADGTSISLYDDGVLAQTITDSAISGNLRVGVASFSITRGDNFIAEDLTVTFKGRLLKRDPACRTLCGGLIHA